MRFFLCVPLFSMILFSSCKKEELTSPIDLDPQVETYSTIKTIIASSCLGCHSSDQNSIIALDSYESLKNYLDDDNTMIDRLNSDIESYRMPLSGSMSDTDKQRLIDWINSGYVE
ncbi:hypothetical protein N9D69_00735 [Flavobacteriales bacterium]|jgi:hypothetical protein|nr:hypothetical protein [Flavobacteriales bacterium]